MEKSFNYVRMHRQRHALSAEDLGRLINRDPGYVSMLEAGRGFPSLEVAMSLQVLFRQQPRQLFPGCFEAAEDGVMERAATMLQELGNVSGSRAAAKREFLEGLPKPDNHDGV